MKLNKLWLSLLLCMILAAAAKAQILISVPNFVVVSGQSLSMSLEVGDVTGQNITAFEFTLTFDPSVVNSVTPYFETTGRLTEGWTVFETHDNTTGTIHVGGFHTTPLTGQGLLLCVLLQVLPDAANGSFSPLTLSEFTFNEGTPSVVFNQGSITVQNLPVPVSLPDTSAIIGSYVCIPVSIGNATHRQVTAFEFTVAFDTALVNTISPYFLTLGGLAEGWTVLESHDNVAGTIHVGGFSTTPLIGQGQLLCMHFQILNTAQESAVCSLIFTQFVFNEGEPAADRSNGSITITCPEPPQVTGVVATNDLCSDVLITWNDVAGETGYDIRRNNVSLGSTPGNVTTFNDVTNSPGIVSVYTVAAYNICGSGPVSLPDSGMRRSVPAQVGGVAASDDAFCGYAAITWSAVSDVNDYRITRNGEFLITIAAPATQYNDISAVPWTRYSYTVTSYNTCGFGVESVADSGSSAAAPGEAFVDASDHEFCDSIYVCWTRVSHVTGYRLLRNGTSLTVLPPDAICFADITAAPGIVYQYSNVPFNACGDGPASLADSGSLRTIPNPPTTFSASDNLCLQVSLTWSYAPGDITGFHIHRNDTLIATVPAGSTQYTDVPPPGTHSYSLGAYNACGNGPSASDQGTCFVAPPGVTGVSATDGLCDRIVVTWNNVSGEDSFQIRRNGIRIGSAAANVLTYTDNSVVPGTYAYRVVAYNLCGAGDSSGTDSGTRLQPLPAVPNVMASDTGCANVLITWSDIAGEDSFQIRRNGQRLAVVNANVTTYTDTPPPGTYLYRIVGYSPCGAGDSSGTDSGTRLQPLPAVANVMASDTGCATILVTWNDIAGEDSFQIRRNGVRIAVANANITTYTDAPLPGTYLYRIVAYSPCGAGDSSGSDSGTRLSPPLATAMSATNQRCDSIIVTWNDLANEDSFIVQRNQVTIARLPANVARYADYPAAGTYLYSVYGRNSCGNGPMASDSGRKLIMPATPDSVQATDHICAQIVVTWRASAGDVNHYSILRNGQEIGTVPFGTNLYLDNMTGHWAYRVVAHSNLCGNSPPSAPDSGWGHISAGSAFGVIASDTLCDRIELSWLPSPGEVERYMIYRDGTVCGTSLDTNYVDHPDDARVHSYQVCAHNSFCGEGELTLPSLGSEGMLAHPLTDIPDTVVCLDTVVAEFDHCDGVQADSIYISLDNGEFLYVAVYSPVVNHMQIVVPYVHALVTPHCRFLLLSVRGLRVDSLISNEFTVVCFDAARERLTSGIPDDFFLDRNYPNPFNPSTTLRFGVPRPSVVALDVYDILGRRTETLYSGTVSPGVHSITWNCAACATGMYLVKMTAEGRVFLQKTVLLK